MCSAKNARLLQNGIEMPFEKRAKVGFKEGGRQNEGRECVESGHCARAREGERDANCEGKSWRRL